MFQKTLKTIVRDLGPFGSPVVESDSEVRCRMPSGACLVAKLEPALPSLRREWAYYIYGCEELIAPHHWGQRYNVFHEALTRALREYGRVPTRIGQIQGEIHADCWCHDGVWDVSFMFGWWSVALSPSLSQEALPFGRAVARGGDPGPVVDWLQENVPSFYQLVEKATNEPHMVPGVYVSKPATMWSKTEEHKYFVCRDEVVADTRERAKAEGRWYEVTKNRENKLEFVVAADGKVYDEHLNERLKRPFQTSV